MKITNVGVRLVTNMNRVQAIASVTFDDEFVVHDIRIVQGDKGLFIAMPSRRLPDGRFKDVAHPLNSEVRAAIQDAILEEYERAKAAVSS